jgi:hypothetical protein
LLLSLFQIYSPCQLCQYFLQLFLEHDIKMRAPHD